MPIWWSEPIPEGHVLLLVKSIYGIKQAARIWHNHISDWMDGYLAVNSEKTIFKKTKGSDHIIHGLFVDDMMLSPHVTSLRRNSWMNILKTSKSQVEAS